MNNALRRNIYKNVMLSFAYAATALTVAVVLFIILYVFIRAIPHVSWQLLSTKPSYINDTRYSKHHLYRNCYLGLCASSRRRCRCISF